MSTTTFQIGPIRPPSEANSILLRVTQNCPWNKCKFCQLYKNTDFHTRKVEDIKKEIDLLEKYRDFIISEKGKIISISKIQKYYDKLETYDEKSCFEMVFRWANEGNREAVFLQDANTLVIKPEFLAEIISYFKERFPEVKRITSYGRASTLAKITKEDFKLLANSGLNRIHSGYESGCENVLTMIGKGGTQEDEILGGRKVKEAGIELSIYFMPGVGGKEYTKENAIETAKVINEVNPDFVRLRTFALHFGSPMEELKETHGYTDLTDMEKLLEIRELLEHIDQSKAKGYIASDHIINLLPSVEGNMCDDLDEIKKYIDGFLQLPEIEQKIYQLARRRGYNIDWTDLNRLNNMQLKELEESVKSVAKEDWEMYLRQFTARYI